MSKKKKAAKPAKKAVKKAKPEKTRPISAEDVTKAIDSMVAKSENPAEDLATVIDHAQNLVEEYADDPSDEEREET